MLYKTPKEIMDEWLSIESRLVELEEEYSANKERLLYWQRLLDAELVISTEYYKGSLLFGNGHRP